MLTGILSRRNTASHRSYFKAQGAPPQPGAARCGGLRQQKTGDTTAVPPAKNHFPMTSYGGIIRIRSRVEVWLLPLSPPHELPCVLFFVGYCTPAGAKKQEQVFLSPFCRLFAKSLLQFSGLCYTCPKFRSARGSHSPLWGTARHKRRLKLWVSSKQPWARHPA